MLHLSSSHGGPLQVSHLFWCMVSGYGQDSAKCYICLTISGPGVSICGNLAGLEYTAQFEEPIPCDHWLCLSSSCIPEVFILNVSAVLTPHFVLSYLAALSPFTKQKRKNISERPLAPLRFCRVSESLAPLRVAGYQWESLALKVCRVSVRILGNLLTLRPDDDLCVAVPLCSLGINVSLCLFACQCLFIVSDYFSFLIWLSVLRVSTFFPPQYFRYWGREKSMKEFLPSILIQKPSPVGVLHGYS